MIELRKVRFGEFYWHVVNDEQGARAGIIGTLLFLHKRGTPLPWRAQYAPIWAYASSLKVAYFATEEEALEFLSTELETATLLEKSRWG